MIIYTFTVKNPSTEVSTTKTIYVGSSPIYRALADGQTIENVNELLDQGGQLRDDGSIYIPVSEESEELVGAETEEIIMDEDESEKKEAVEISTEVVDKVSNNTETDAKVIDKNVLVEQDKPVISNMVIFSVIGIGITIIILVLVSRRNKSKRKNGNNIDIGESSIQKGE